MRWRRRVTVYAVALMFPFFIQDVLNGGPKAPALVAIKVTWALSLSVLGFLLPYVSVPTRAHLFTGLVFTSSLGMSAIAFVTGDHHSTYFVWLVAMPFCMVVFAQEEVIPAVVGCVTCFLGAVVVITRSDISLDDRIQWLLCAGVAGAIGIYASIRQRAHFDEELKQNQARLQALDQLGDSEKRRAQAERMALVGQLAAGVAHEINNPLGFVIANLQFLEAELETPTVSEEERKLVIGETQLGLKRIKDIVGDLNAFSRDGNERTSEVDLHEVITEAERMALARTKGRISFLNQLPPDVRHVIGNRRHLSQVFLNLFLNSADALGAGRDDGKIWIRAIEKGEGVEVEVEDNGPGFDDKVLPSLFTPFFTTKPPGKGTGLGLATSREYMRRAGGDLLAMPRPGGGARFTLALRRAP